MSRATVRLKRTVRGVLDRAAVPYVNTINEVVTGSIRGLEARLAAAAAPVPAPPAEPAPVPVLDPLVGDVNVFLHELRSIELSAMPPGASTLLSAGCAGGWFFDWVEQRYGPVERHVGVELYVPEPADLPANVEWIASDLTDLRVGDGSVELVFSGQNLEHLWPEQLAGFLNEANRVLAPDGLLVVDSPNREITAALGWSQPEHTVELSPAEAIELLDLAGFETASCRGVWLCRDQGEVLPFSPAELPPERRPDVLRRAVLAARRPEDSFIWWIEARKVRPPSVTEVRARAEELYEQHWPERANRLRTALEVSVRDGRRFAVSPGDHTGLVITGPGLPLRAGPHQVAFHLRPVDAGGDVPLATCQVVAPASGILATAEWSGGDPVVTVPFDLADTTFGLSFEVVAHGQAPFEAELAIELS